VVRTRFEGTVADSDLGSESLLQLWQKKHLSLHDEQMS